MEKITKELQSTSKNQREVLDQVIGIKEGMYWDEHWVL